MNTSLYGTRMFVDRLSSYGYYPCIRKPTRVFKRSATLIDHVWTNNIDIVSGTGILMTDVTDHFAPVIHCKGKNDKVKQLYFSYRDYKNINKDLICQTMKEALDNLHMRHMIMLQML